MLRRSSSVVVRRGLVLLGLVHVQHEATLSHVDLDHARDLGPPQQHLRRRTTTTTAAATAAAHH